MRQTAAFPTLRSSSRPLAAALLGIASACGGEPEPVTPTPAPTVEADSAEVMLTVDGLSITRGELEQAATFITASLPAAGRKARWRAVLEQVVQRRLFHREFADELAEKLERAQALYEATRSNGYPELVTQGEPFGGNQRELPFARASLPPLVSRWVFQMENLGQVSPPIPVPQGYMVVSCGLLEPGTTTEQDLAHVFTVPFFALDGTPFGIWWTDLQARLAPLVTFAHPDMEGVLPPWLQDS